MRALAFILVGLMLGALISVTALNFLNRGPQTHKAIMQMMKYQVDTARAVIDPGCPNGGNVQRQLTTLRALSEDLDAIYVARGFDKDLFGKQSQQMRERLDKALTTEWSSCPAQVEAMNQVRQGCKSCHDEFEG
jgi:cytochrome c556